MTRSTTSALKQADEKLGGGDKMVDSRGLTYDDWDDDVALNSACERAILKLKKGSKCGIIKPLHTTAVLLESKGTGKTKRLRFNLTAEQEEKADYPYRERWKRSRKERRRTKKLENFCLVRPEGQVTAGFITAAGIKQKIYLAVVKEADEAVEKLEESRSAEYFKNAKELKWTIPDNVNDYVTITEYAPRSNGYEDMKWDYDDEVEINKDAIFRFWRRLCKIEPKYSL